MLKISVPDTASYIRGWIQMVLTPNDLFSWNNKYSTLLKKLREIPMWTSVARTKWRGCRKFPTPTSFGSAPPLSTSEFGAFSVSTRIYTSTMDSLFVSQLCTSTYSVHASILKLWRGRLPCPLVVFSFHHVSRLSSSFFRSQLTLLVPALRIRPPLSQDGAPIHRVRTHSVSRVQHN